MIEQNYNGELFFRAKNNSPTQIDLIVLSHNGLSTTKDFLFHFFKSTSLLLCRLIWVDNGSTDGTTEYLKTELENKDNVILHLSKENKGVIGGRNFGYKLSQYNPSPSIMFLDNDQFVHGDWLEQHILFSIHGHYDLIGIEAWQMSHLFMPIQPITSIKQRFNYVGCGGMWIKREVVEKIGLLDEMFNPAYFEDPDICWRTNEAGYKIGWNYKAQIIHMPHQTLGKSKNKNNDFTNSYVKFRQKWNGKKMPVFRQEEII